MHISENHRDLHSTTDSLLIIDPEGGRGACYGAEEAPQPLPALGRGGARPVYLLSCSSVLEVTLCLRWSEEPADFTESESSSSPGAAAAAAGAVEERGRTSIVSSSVDICMAPLPPGCRHTGRGGSVGGEVGTATVDICTNIASQTLVTDEKLCHYQHHLLIPMQDAYSCDCPPPPSAEDERRNEPLAAAALPTHSRPATTVRQAT